MILHCISSSGLYGIERMLLALLPALQNAGHRTGLVCLAPSGTQGALVGKAVEALGLPAWYLTSSSRLSRAAIGTLREVMRTQDAAIVHCHGFKATVLAGGLALFERRALVATYHAEAAPAIAHLRGIPAARLRAYLWLEGRVLRRARRIVAVSTPIEAELIRRGIPPNRIVVQPNGIDDHGAASGTGRSGSTFTLVTIGRLVGEKNTEALLHALARLRPAHPELRLVIAGDGPLRTALEATARSLDIGEAVEFAGFVDDVRPLLSQCDCFVMPSHTEGMPMALLEAMAARRPIVVTAVGSIPTVVRDGREALLIPPGSLDQLTGALRRVLTDPDLRQRLAEGARARFLAGYTAQRMAEGYVQVYRQVIGGDS